MISTFDHDRHLFNRRAQLLSGNAQLSNAHVWGFTGALSAPALPSRLPRYRRHFERRCDLCLITATACLSARSSMVSFLHASTAFPKAFVCVP